MTLVTSRCVIPLEVEAELFLMSSVEKGRSKCKEGAERKPWRNRCVAMVIAFAVLVRVFAGAGAR